MRKPQAGRAKDGQQSLFTGKWTHQHSVQNQEHLLQPHKMSLLMSVYTHTHTYTCTAPSITTSTEGSHWRWTTWTFQTLLTHPENPHCYMLAYGHTFLTLRSSHSFILISRPCFLTSFSLHRLFANILSSRFILEIASWSWESSSFNFSLSKLCQTDEWVLSLIKL